MDRQIRQRTGQQGFTLVELMVVIMIIGILVAIALPNMVSAQERARVASLKTNAHTLQVVVETYHIDNLHYPNSATQIESMDGYQVFKNPFFPSLQGKATSTGQGGWWTNDDGDASAPANALMGACGESDRSKGLVIYLGLDDSGAATTTFDSADGSNGNPNPTTNYHIYGCDEAGQAVHHLVLSVGTLTPAAAALAE